MSLDTLVDLPMQHRIWGAMWTGGYEKTAVLAENHHREGSAYRLDMWDRTRRSLNDQEIRTPDGERHPVPEWFALPWVAEHLARHGYTLVNVEAGVHFRGDTA